MARTKGATCHGRLVGLYLAGIAGVGYAAKQILGAQRAVRIPTDMIVVSGGAGQDPLVRQILADSTGVAVAATTSRDPVLLGSAMPGAVASQRHADLEQAMQKMSEIGEICEPQTDLRAWRHYRFTVFEFLQRANRDIRGLAASSVAPTGPR